MLTDTQLIARKGKLTASRVAALMTGDRDKIMRLYQEMIGDAVEEDLSAVWPVRLGEATEQLNLDWYERKSKNGPLTDRGKVVISGILSWAACTIDGWDTTLQCPVEAKHVGGREPLEVVIDRYQPQMQWQMAVTEATQCALSIIVGANEPVIEYVERDESYIAEMISRGAAFMLCVRTRTPPIELAAVPPPIKAEKVYDMSESNSWAEASYTWLQSRESAERNSNAEKILKSMVPEDALKAFGHGTRVTRDKARRLSLRKDT